MDRNLVNCDDWERGAYLIQIAEIYIRTRGRVSNLPHGIGNIDGLKPGTCIQPRDSIYKRSTATDVPDVSSCFDTRPHHPFLSGTAVGLNSKQHQWDRGTAVTLGHSWYSLQYAAIVAQSPRGRQQHLWVNNPLLPFLVAIDN